MRFALILCVFAVSKSLLIVLGLPYENELGEPLFIKEARNFGGILGGGTGGGFPGIGGGSNIRFYKLNVPPRTTKAPDGEKCANKATCCKYTCTVDCKMDATAKDGSDACKETADGSDTTVPGKPCLNSEKCPACVTFAETANDPNCTPKTTKCPVTGTEKVCPAEKVFY